MRKSPITDLLVIVVKILHVVRIMLQNICETEIHNTKTFYLGPDIIYPLLAELAGDEGF